MYNGNRKDVICPVCLEPILAGEGIQQKVTLDNGDEAFVHTDGHGGHRRSCFDIFVRDRMNGSGMQ